MRRAGTLGFVLLAGLAACDLDASYRKYCETHPGDCAGAGSDGGGDAGADGDFATQLRLSLPATSGGYEPRQCITGFLATSTDQEGQVMALREDGKVELAFAPAAGAEIYDGAACITATRVGPVKTIPVAGGGGGVAHQFSVQASLAGRYALAFTTGLLNVSNAPAERLDFPAQLAFVGAPASMKEGECVGPVRVMLLDDVGVTIGTNAAVDVDLAMGPGIETRANAGCTTDAGVVSVDAGAALSHSFYLLGTAATGSPALTASAGIHRMASEPIALSPSSSTATACIRGGAPCFVSIGTATGCCDAGTCVNPGRGYGVCQ